MASGCRKSLRFPGEYWLPWAELLRKKVGVDPEICICGARVIVDDAITDGENLVSTGPTRRRQSTGKLDYVFDV